MFYSKWRASLSALIRIKWNSAAFRDNVLDADHSPTYTRLNGALGGDARSKEET